jgi:3-methyladenine DNA glycosylase AlkD
MKGILEEVRRELRERADGRTKASGMRFFKEEVALHGVTSAEVGAIGKRYFAAVECLEKGRVWALCEGLWESGYLEEALIACQWAYRLRGRYERGDFRVFSRWLKRYVGNWAACDTLCNHTMAAFVDRYPNHLGELKKWARSRNRWVRRAAAVTLIVPAREGRYLGDIFEIADVLLGDEDDLVQKGYGWMLKAASEAHRVEVFEYVMRHRKEMPRTALRYAIEKMPEGMKRRAMAREAGEGGA